MGRKRFYVSCVAVFTVSSFLCGIAPNMPLLLLFRIIQGAGGGGLAPSEQSILADTFEPRKRGQAFALYGVAVVVAPAIQGRGARATRDSTSLAIERRILLNERGPSRRKIGVGENRVDRALLYAQPAVDADSGIDVKLLRRGQAFLVG